jgi:alkylation response protein AidB-like acyl-CoA dehydrogenase
VPSAAGLNDARAFAESVAGVLDRHAPAPVDWTPGEIAVDDHHELADRLDEVGWNSVTQDRDLGACAGLGALELGRRLAAVRHVDCLLGGAPAAGDLVRSLGAERVAVGREHGAILRRRVARSEAVASAEGLEVHRLLELGEPLDECDQTVVEIWMAASIGYLAGLGEGALGLTVAYVRDRRAFGSTLAALPAVQHRLADAATAVRGVRLLAVENPGVDALAHAGSAVADACAACHQVTGAIGFTLEYPLHRYTQRARGLATWNDALIEHLIGP